MEEGRGLGAGTANPRLWDQTDHRPMGHCSLDPTAPPEKLYETFLRTIQQGREGPGFPQWSRAGLQDVQSLTLLRCIHKSAHTRCQRSPRQEVRSYQFAPAPGERGLGRNGYRVSVSEARPRACLVWEVSSTLEMGQILG